MKTFVIACPEIGVDDRFNLQDELSKSFSRSAFVQALENIWLVRCDVGADDVHLILEGILTSKVDFIIYELADNLDFVQNVEGYVSEWTDVNF